MLWWGWLEEDLRAKQLNDFIVWDHYVALLTMHASVPTRDVCLVIQDNAPTCHVLRNRTTKATMVLAVLRSELLVLHLLREAIHTNGQTTVNTTATVGGISDNKARAVADTVVACCCCAFHGRSKALQLQKNN